jgi:hypothetical protein
MAAVNMPVRFGRLVLLTVMFTLFMSEQAGAAAIRTLEITHTEESYHVTFDVLLATRPEKVRLLLSDYHQWPRLSDTLEEAELLALFPDGRQRVRLGFRACVLIFCKTVRQVKDVTTGPRTDILAAMVPELGDFAFGWERWQILAEEDETRIRYTADIAPSFALPPLIGPMILIGELRSMLVETAMKLETLAIH